MNKYGQIVMWIGLVMILFYLTKNWSVLSPLFFAKNSGSVVGGLKLPGPTGIPPNPATGHCPPGYISANGKCYSPAVNPPQPSGGGLA